ncbi:MAG TPA: lysylphosphatidylglycerol synthase transmembrane domain-containing protein [Candidatus Limnocylindria bacterium]|nr:lysylphosphatidylglycerol synthase transmembrane domain-containing protein [Candidatus Limnocylindria bacterium]
MIRLPSLARYALGAIVLAAVLWALNPTEVSRTLAGSDLALVSVGLAVLVAMHAVVGAGWRWLIAQRTGERLPLGVALRAHYAAQAAGSITPGNLGADVHRAALLRRAGHGWSGAVEPIIVQRATSYLALSVLAGIGLVILSSSSELSRVAVFFGGGVAVILVAASWLLLTPTRRFGALRARMRRLVDGESASAPDDAPRPTWRLMLGGIANGVVFHAGSVVATWLLVLAMNPQTPLWPMLAAITVARLSLAVPISPSGLGIQEGVLAALVSSIGLAPQPALAAMLVARLSTLLLASIGVTLLLVDRPVQLSSSRATLRGQPAGRGDAP